MFCFVGAMIVLLGQSPLAEVEWLGTRLGDVLTVLGAIGVLSPLPVLFLTSLAALRLLEGIEPNASQIGTNQVATNATAPRDAQTQLLAWQSPPSADKNALLSLDEMPTRWDVDDLPTTRPN
jgi:hypothetical protein